MGYNAASVRDICKIFAPIGEASGLGHRKLPMKFFSDRPLLLWQRNLRQNAL